MDEESTAIGDRVAWSAIDRDPPVAPRVAREASLSDPPPIPVSGVVPAEAVNLAWVDLPRTLGDGTYIYDVLVRRCRTREPGARWPSADVATLSIPENEFGPVVGERRSTLGLLLSPTPSRRTPGTFPAAIQSLPPELPVTPLDRQVKIPDASFRLQRGVEAGSSFSRGAAGD